MTQEKALAKKLADFSSLFLMLDNKGQDAALTVLQSLNFAQSVVSSRNQQKKQSTPNKQGRLNSPPEFEEKRNTVAKRAGVSPLFVYHLLFFRIVS